jgi:type II secretory pathway pseudopilin PulG
MRSKHLSRGFSVIEVILAAAIFMVFASAAVIVILGGYNTNRLGAEETVATQFAAEGIEAVKSIKNQAYSNLSNTSGIGLKRNATTGVWEWQTSPPNNTLIHNISDNYSREIKVENVNRDASGNIVSTGGTLDPDTKKVTSTVSWNFNAARPESVSFITYLTDWKKPIKLPMMAYSQTTNIPYYRTWDGSGWSTEEAAQSVGGGGSINYVVLKGSRTRNEFALGTLDSSGNIYVQIWDGTSWGIPTLMANVGSANAITRSFDIEYEKNSDRAVIAYLPTPTSADFDYRYWDGSVWSAPETVTAPPTTGLIKWIEVAQNPLSNEIALILFDANSDIYGMVWNGASWDTMGVTTIWHTSASTEITRKAIAVAYEQTSGRAMFIWATSTTRTQNYRIWNGVSLTANTTLTIAGGGLGQWVKLVSRPNSNELMYGMQNSGADLLTRRWSDSAWDGPSLHPEHDASTETTESMDFDLVWETHAANPGKAWLMWGNGSSISKKQWTTGAPTPWGSTSTLTGSDDTSFIRLKADPSSGAIFAGIYESPSSATDDIWESRLTGGGTTWSAKNIIWGGPTFGTSVFFRVDISTP